MATTTAINYYVEPLSGSTRGQLWADVLDGPTYRVGSPAPIATVRAACEQMNGGR